VLTDRTPVKADALARALGCVIVALAASALTAAQTAERFRAHLSVVPVNAATARTTTGTGTIHGTLAGSELTLTGVFEGMSSAATEAHLHHAPKGRRGPPVLTVPIPGTAAGEVDVHVVLTAGQIQALRSDALYLQIHTEGNPDGEIRGWLLEDR
jgi:hypothetical protein